MDLDVEHPQWHYRREPIGSYQELSNVNQIVATNHSPVSSWAVGPQSPNNDDNSVGRSQSDTEETRAPLKRSTSSRNLYVRSQTDFDHTLHSKGQQQTDDKKPEPKSKSRYGGGPWDTWNSNVQSQPMHQQQHHFDYGQQHPQPAPGYANPFAPNVRSQFAPSVHVPYGDSRYASASYDYRPYVTDRLNPLVRNPPNYSQPWTQQISTVSMPYSLMGPRLDTGVKDFSSYSFAPLPVPPVPEDWQGHGIAGSSQSLPGRLHSKVSDDFDDDRRDVVLPGEGLDAARPETISSRTKKSRRRSNSRRAELSMTKGSFAPEHPAQLVPLPVSSQLDSNSTTLGGAEAVPLPPSRSHSPIDHDLALEDNILPPLPPNPTLGRDNLDRAGTVQQTFSKEWPITTEHNKPLLAHSRTANEVLLDQNKTLYDDLFPGTPNVDDLLATGDAAKAKSAKKGKKNERKTKAVKPISMVVEASPPPMPPPILPPFLQPDQEPIIIEFDESHRPKKPKKKKIQRSGFADWVAGQTLGSSRHPTSSYAQRIDSLMSCMPHLKALYSFQRDLETNPVITRLDYKNNIENPRRKSRRVFRSRDWLGPNSKAFAKKLSAGGSSSAFLRVLFIEDLTSALIDTLGTLYGVDPELFASHMSSSGSSNLSYDDPPPARWSTAKMRKSYYSLKWYRPVRLEKRVSQWLRNPKDLAKLGEDGIEWSETTHERRGQDIYEKKTHHNVTLNNNIFRRSWPLSSDPDGAPGDGLHAAWEEKASVFMAPKDGLTTSEYSLYKCSN